MALLTDCSWLIGRRMERDGFRPERWRYRWDAHDRLVAVTMLDGEEWPFRCDPFGRRASKVRRFSGEKKERAARLFPALDGADGAPAQRRANASDGEQSDHNGNALPLVGTRRHVYY